MPHQKPSAPKAVDLRLVIKGDVADILRHRAQLARRTLQEQAVIEIERGITHVNEPEPV